MNANQNLTRKRKATIKLRRWKRKHPSAKLLELFNKVKPDMLILSKLWMEGQKVPHFQIFKELGMIRQIPDIKVKKNDRWNDLLSKALN